MRTINFGFGMPKEMQDAWMWVVALDAWDYCDPKLLAELVNNEPIPIPLRPVIASIVIGERKPNKKAAGKLKISPTERMKIAGTLSCILGLIDAIKFDSTSDSCPERGISEVAYRKGIEPIEVKRELEDDSRNTIKSAATELGVSVETVENLVRSLRDKIQDWPNI